MSQELPKGWARTPANTLFGFVTSGSRGWAQYYAPTGAKFIRVGNVRRGDISLDLSDMQHVQPPAAGEGTRTALQPHDVVITITADLGRVGFVDESVGHAYVNQHVSLARPNLPEMGRYLAWFFTSPDAQAQLGLYDRGATRAGLGLSDIGSVVVPSAPLQEQHRIVAKIDSLFSRSSRARDELARIPRLIERYRQAVLEAAFRGDFTADWREANPGASAEVTIPAIERAAKKGRRQEKQFTLDLPAIPAAWAWSTFGNCILGYQNGLSKREGTSGTPENVLRLADIDGGRIVSESPRQIILNAVEKADYELRPDDLIFIRVNGSTSLVGRCLLFSENSYWAFCDHFIRARTNPKTVDPAFARLFFDTPFTRGLIENSFVSSAGQKTISQGTLSALPIPLPPVAEQMLIVKRVEEAFACARRSADQAAAAQNLLTRLDASILDKAFTGKLVPQDPADEPASALLERIRAARAEAPKPKRGRRAKA